MSSGESSGSHCTARYEVSCSEPRVEGSTGHCSGSCGDSRAIIYPPPVAVTFPGPIFATCLQDCTVEPAVPEIWCYGTGSGGGGMVSFSGGMGSGGSYGGGGSYGSGMGWRGEGSCDGGSSRLGSIYRSSFISGYGRNFFPSFSRGYYRYRYGNNGPF